MLLIHALKCSALGLIDPGFGFHDFTKEPELTEYDEREARVNSLFNYVKYFSVQLIISLLIDQQNPARYICTMLTCYVSQRVEKTVLKFAITEMAADLSWEQKGHAVDSDFLFLSWIHQLL